MVEQAILDLPDITEGRHGGNEESRAAFRRARPTRAADRVRVLRACRRWGGVTCRELAAEWSVPMHAISGRFSELKALHLIEKSGVRDGSGVCVLTPAGVAACAVDTQNGDLSPQREGPNA